MFDFDGVNIALVWVGCVRNSVRTYKELRYLQLE